MSIVTKKLISTVSKNLPLSSYSLPFHLNIHVACSTSAPIEGKEGRAADGHADEKELKDKAEREAGGGLKEKTKETVEAAAGKTKEEIHTVKKIPKKVKESVAGAKESIEDAVDDVARPAEERREKPVDQSEMHVDRRAIDERKHQ